MLRLYLKASLSSVNGMGDAFCYGVGTVLEFGVVIDFDIKWLQPPSFVISLGGQSLSR